MGKGLRSNEHRAVMGVLVGARKSRRLTQKQLAKRLRKPQSYISKIELGERSCGVGEFIRIARALREDPKVLFARVVDW
jgi:transcriptional regulator with XRE-family HTH domain